MSASGRIAYQPALDGVRALAVIAVIFFHAGTPGFGGGYLGVSVFFTLSGYLITSLLISEHAHAGSIDLRGFYGRRLRRLAPASLVTIAAVVAIAACTGVFDGVVGLRGQVVGSVLQVQNWVLLSGSSSYQDLLAQASGAVSPLAHFWSLAIEEQFYWLWPPVMLVLLTRLRRRRTITWVIGGITAVAMVAAPLIAVRWGADAAYWATPARLGEILVGALLACVLDTPRLPKRFAVLAPVSLAVLVVSVILFPTSGGPAYHGALPLVGVVSGGLIVGLQPDSGVRRALSWAPLVAIGRISYGLYLVHWPVFVIVDSERTGLEGPALTVVRLLITTSISLASFRLIERPIRVSTRIPLRSALTATAVVSIVLGAVALVALPAGPTDFWHPDADVVTAAAIDTDVAPIALVPTATETTAVTTTTVGPPDASAAAVTEPTVAVTAPSTTSPVPIPARPIRIIVTGDSTGEALGTGIVQWAANNPASAQAEVHAAPGCGFLMGGDRLWGDTMVSTSSCDGWPDAQLYPVVERTRPDVVVVMTSTWDLVDRRWDGGAPLAPADAEFRARLVEAYSTLVDELAASGAARVVLVREPVPDVWWNGSMTGEADPARHAVLASVYDEIAAAHADTVRVVDLATWFSAAGLDDVEAVRPDGIHLAPDAATVVVDEFLGDELLRAVLG